jgi:diguanylate cyclase (GGDEF)-like protein
MGIFFIDIDDFKKINDQHGHAIGDQVLVMVANTLHENLRSEDTVARWGGEEFLALLPGLDAAGMAAVAQKLTALVGYSALRVKEQNISVTVSMGMTLARQNDTVKTLVERADKNMYKSKQAGRSLITGDETVPEKSSAESRKKQKKGRGK